MIGSPFFFNQFNQERMQLDILKKLLILSINILDKKNILITDWDWYEFITNTSFLVIIALFGILIELLLS